MKPLQPHGHTWIDPEESPPQVSHRPVIGPLPDEMQMDRLYVCRECGAAIVPRDVLRLALTTSGTPRPRR